jgi:hypothetical protein
MPTCERHAGVRLKKLTVAAHRRRLVTVQEGEPVDGLARLAHVGNEGGVDRGRHFCIYNG